MINITQAERIRALEIQVAMLVAEQQETNRNMKETNVNLQTLLNLRNKGAGVFWLASVLFGTSIIGCLAFVLSLFRGS